MTTRRLLPWLLVCAFLWLQGVAAAHGVEHARNEGKSGVPAHACVLCLAGQHLDAAPPSLPLIALLPPLPAAPEATPVGGFRLAPFSLQRARGPPRWFLL